MHQPPEAARRPHRVHALLSAVPLRPHKADWSVVCAGGWHGSRGGGGGGREEDRGGDRVGPLRLSPVVGAVVAAHRVARTPRRRVVPPRGHRSQDGDPPLPLTQWAPPLRCRLQGRPTSPAGHPPTPSTVTCCGGRPLLATTTGQRRRRRRLLPHTSWCGSRGGTCPSYAGVRWTVRRATVPMTRVAAAVAVALMAHAGLRRTPPRRACPPSLCAAVAVARVALCCCWRMGTGRTWATLRDRRSAWRLLFGWTCWPMSSAAGVEHQSLDLPPPGGGEVPPAMATQTAWTGVPMRRTTGTMPKSLSTQLVLASCHRRLPSPPTRGRPTRMPPPAWAAAAARLSGGWWLSDVALVHWPPLVLPPPPAFALLG